MSKCGVGVGVSAAEVVRRTPTLPKRLHIVVALSGLDSTVWLLISQRHFDKRRLNLLKT